MGDIADDIIDGFICQYCCCPMPDGDEPGYPRTCLECLDDEDD